MKRKDLPPGLRSRLELETEEYLERQHKLDGAQHDASTPGSDKSLPANQRQEYTGDADAAKKDFTSKIYMFPESFNALRRELHEHWQTLFYTPLPNFSDGRTLSWTMVGDAPTFIATMNGALNLMEQLDSDNVDHICKTFLDALRVKREVSKLH